MFQSPKSGVNDGVALTVAGSDPSGGAGIQADHKTFAAHGVYGASVITALTVQNTKGVSEVLHVPDAVVAGQLEAIATDLNVRATKTGMLYDANCIMRVAEACDKFDLGSLVIDPVMIASSGKTLLDDAAVDVLTTHLMPKSVLITPNLAEASRLLNQGQADGVNEMIGQCESLCKLGARAVLLKGGHGSGSESIDVFFDASGPRQLSLPRVKTTNTHGTGCTLSAAIASHLVQGEQLYEAVFGAKQFVWAALVAAKDRKFGMGCGALLHHFAWT